MKDHLIPVLSNISTSNLLVFLNRNSYYLILKYRTMLTKLQELRKFVLLLNWSIIGVVFPSLSFIVFIAYLLNTKIKKKTV